MAKARCSNHLASSYSPVWASASARLCRAIGSRPVGHDISASRTASRAATAASAYLALASSRCDRLTRTRTVVTTSPVVVVARSASSRWASFRAPVLVLAAAMCASARASGSPRGSAMRSVSVDSASPRRAGREGSGSGRGRLATRHLRHRTPRRSSRRRRGSAGLPPGRLRCTTRSPAGSRDGARSLRRAKGAPAGRGRAVHRHRLPACVARPRGYAGPRASARTDGPRSRRPHLGRRRGAPSRRRARQGGARPRDGPQPVRKPGLPGTAGSPARRPRPQARAGRRRTGPQRAAMTSPTTGTNDSTPPSPGRSLGTSTPRCATTPQTGRPAPCPSRQPVGRTRQA